MLKHKLPLWLSVLTLGISSAAFVLLIPGSVLLGMKTSILIGLAVAFMTGFCVWRTDKLLKSGHRLSLLSQDSVLSWKVLLPRILFDVLLLITFCVIFCLYASFNERVIALTDQLNVPKRQLLTTAAGTLGVLAFPFVRVLHQALTIALPKLAKRISTRPTGKLLLRAALVLLVLSGLYYSLQVSIFGLRASVLEGGRITFLCNLCFLLLLEALLALLLGNTKQSLLVCSVLITLWAIANYYVIQYHGSPLIFSEFQNFKTAMAVAGGYRYRITLEILIIVVVGAAGWFLVCACAPVLLWKWRFKASLVALCTLIASCLTFGNLYPRVVADDFIALGWYQSVKFCGFLVYSVEDLERRASGGIVEPSNYSSANLPEAETLELPGLDDSDYPDIILILNETFYDLDVYLDMDTDIPALEAFNSIPCVARGYAAVPHIGGGTNDSEFELLMSKSEYLLSPRSPFVWMRNEQLGRNIVEYLKVLGYETTGMHVETSNYNRNNAYRAIGFDHIHLGENQPNSDASSYGRRQCTDAAFYEDLKLHYGEIDSSRPQFFFLLTLQNHGGYEENDPSYDTVHVLNDFDGYTDDLDEYLTSVRLSSEAFKELTEYYNTVDRKTILCMVGDHAPSMIRNFPAKAQITSEEEKEVTQRMVPYIIWANYDIDSDGMLTDYASMVDLVPMILDAAGLPQSIYYSTILSLHNELPVRTSNGLVMDRSGEIYSYPSETEVWNELLDQYYNLEYHSLLPKSEYRAELFSPGSGS